MSATNASHIIITHEEQGWLKIEKINMDFTNDES